MTDPTSGPVPPAGPSAAPTPTPTYPAAYESGLHPAPGDPYAAGGHPGHPGPTDGTGTGRPAGTDGLSIAALVTGILWTGPVAIGLGIGGLVRTRRSGRGGRGLAIAGIVLGGLGTLCWVLVIGLLAVAVSSDEFKESFAEGFEDGLAQELDGSRADAGLVLVSGDCIALPPEDAEITSIDHLGCEVAHDAEIVGVQDLTGDAYPGLDRVFDTADSFCYDAFTGYVGAELEETDLDLSYLYPTDASWATGDRQVSCFATALDGTSLDASVADSAR